MSEPKDVKDALEQLAHENAKLRGQMLATGVILTQLLQSNCLTQLNPRGFATKIMKDASDAVEGFKPEETERLTEIMKATALETVKQYDDQIQSILPI